MARTLFLDRDGVINRRIPDGYVTTLDEFHFLPGVLEVMSVFANVFQYVIIVTNQQGIGKGLMTPEELEQIHNYMTKRIRESHGRIDAIYHCPNLEMENHPCRKPEVGMGLLAKKDFPDIDFTTSWMVGDSWSDILFGKKLKMKTAFVRSSQMPVPKNCDLVVSGLKEFAQKIPDE